MTENSPLRERIAAQQREIANIDRNIAGLQEARARRLKNLRRLVALLAIGEPAETPPKNG